MTMGILVVLSAAIFISLSNVLTPIVYDAGGNPLTFLTLRLFGFVVICRLWFLSKGKRTNLSMPLRLSAYGSGTAYAIGAGALLGSFAYMPVSLAILVFFTFPILTGLFVSLLDRQWPPLIEVVCVMFTFFGLFLALDVSIGSLNLVGVGLALLGAVGVSTSYVWNGRSLGTVDSTISTLHMAMGGLTVATIATLSLGTIAFPSESTVGWIAFGGGILCFSAAFFSMFFAVRLIGPVRSAMIMNLEPVITITLSLWILHESLSSKQFVGAVLVIVSVAAFQIVDAGKKGQG